MQYGGCFRLLDALTVRSLRDTPKLVALPELAITQRHGLARRG